MTSIDREPKELPRRRSLLLWLMQKQWRMKRSLTLGGQVCVLGPESSVLLVRHGYRPGWHFPGGGIEFGENVRDAALRELEEETGLVANGEARLHGVFNNGTAYPGDHIVLYVIDRFERRRTPEPSFEIVEQGFFKRTELPAQTTGGTRRRVAEIFDRLPPDQRW